MYYLIALFMFLFFTLQSWSGSLLGHVRLVDDNGRRQNPQVLAIGFRSLTARVERQQKIEAHQWFIDREFEPYILVVKPFDTVEFHQKGKPIKDLLILGRSQAYRTGDRQRVTSRDFSKKGYYQIEEHSAPGVLGRLYVDQNDFLIRPDKRGLLRLENIPHGLYIVSIYNIINKMPLSLEVKILEEKTTALRINLNHKILRRES